MAWKFSETGGKLTIEMGPGQTQTLPVAEAQRYFDQGLAMCTSASQTNSSKTATASGGGKSPKKAAGRKAKTAARK